MPVTNVGDPVSLIFDAVPNVSVTATVLPPIGQVWPAEPVAASTTPGEEDQYPYTFWPDRTGLWRVTFRATGSAVASATYNVTVTDPTAGPPPYATSDDIAAMWRTLTDEETTRADVLCRLASQLMRTRVPVLDERIADGRTPAEAATLVCSQMVIRSLRNPGGIASETTGPWSVTYSTAAQTNQGLVLLAEDIALLLGVDPARLGRVGQINLRPGLPSAARRAWGAEI